MARRTKIVATIGPASSSPDVIRAMIDAGMDMARVSASHAPIDEVLALCELVRSTAAQSGRHIGILADLPGPKVRAAEFHGKNIELAERSTVTLTDADPGDASTATRIAIDHRGATASLHVGDKVVLGDGAIELVVVDTHGAQATAEVLTGGFTSGRPGVAMPSSDLPLQTPTARDLSLLQALCEVEVDMIAISFVQRREDIERARAAMPSDGPVLVAKLETPQAVENIEEIVATADGVMVARGDLGIRCALEDVPHLQKQAIHTSVAFGRPVITATQMLESMVHAPVPTRAEVSDVANAVFDGTSALMLSGETAIGRHPVAAVSTMSRIAERAERDFDSYNWGRAIGKEQSLEAHNASTSKRITTAISAAAWRAAMDAEVTAIIACTVEGSTPRAISRFRPTAPILAVTPKLRTARQLSVAWGITPLIVDFHEAGDEVIEHAIDVAVRGGYVRTGDLVAVLVGSHADPGRASDTLHVFEIP